MVTHLKEEFDSAGRFYPNLHSFILQGFLMTPPKMVTIVQLKALAVAATGGQQWAGCNCGGNLETAEMFARNVGVTQNEFRRAVTVQLGDGASVVPKYSLVSEHVSLARTQAKKIDGGKDARIILSGAWGIWGLPFMNVHEPNRWDEALTYWDRYVKDAAFQAATIIQQMDHALCVNEGDFGRATAAVYAPLGQTLNVVVQGSAIKTLNRLLSSGHKAG